MIKEALFYKKNSDLTITCLLCPHYCKIAPESTGICKVRKNIKGVLYAISYGIISGIALDPIEKKPLFNFYPGSKILSVGGYGCNFKCDFCQNWSISQSAVSLSNESIITLPETLIKEALPLVSIGNIGIAFTYNEPFIWYEYILETAILLKANNLKCVIVTNGYINTEPLKQLLPYVDAMNIDLKSFNNNFYNNTCGGSIENVKKTIVLANEFSHIELTSLIIPGLNDSNVEMEKMASWISNINPNITLHLSRYFPKYKRESPGPTPIETLLNLKTIAEKHLKHVYLGNV